MPDRSDMHRAVWSAIDAIAEARGVSLDRLGVEAGGSRTLFHRSHRTEPTGKLRWLSTRTIARLLDATGMDFVQFGYLVELQRKRITGGDAHGR